MLKGREEREGVLKGGEVVCVNGEDGGDKGRL